MPDEVDLLSDEILLGVCRASERDLEAVPALLDELRLASQLIPPSGKRHGGQLEHAMAFLASTLGKLPDYRPSNRHPGYTSNGLGPGNWIDSEDLESVARQLVGLIWADRDPGYVSMSVSTAITNAVNLSLIEKEDYDSWRPGMASGKGWRSAVSATTYGIAKARAMGKRQVDATTQSAASSPAAQRPAQDPPWARKVAQPDGRPAADAPASKQSVPVSWQDAPAPHLPAGMEPLDKTLVEMLLRLPTMWASVDFERLTNTEEKALARLVEAGLVEERVVATAWMDGFPQVAILRGRVTGDFKRRLLWESVQSVPEWLTEDGKTRGRYSFWYDVTEVRLTDAGETARHDWNSPEPSFVLAIVRGIGGSTRGISPDGVVKIEERKVETREKPPAPSDVRALLREGFTLNRVPTSDEVDAGTAIASAKKVIGEPVEGTISEVTRRNIFDALRIDNVQWAGRLGEIEFLERLHDLDSIPSTEPRFTEGVAEEIWQHRVNNPEDWPDDWVFRDSRFGLPHGPDELLLRFLCEMIHPLVRPEADAVEALLATFNTHLAADGWEIVKCREVSGKPVFGPQRISTANPSQPGRGAVAPDQPQPNPVTTACAERSAEQALCEMPEVIHTDCAIEDHDDPVSSAKWAWRCLARFARFWCRNFCLRCTLPESDSPGEFDRAAHGHECPDHATAIDVWPAYLKELHESFAYLPMFWTESGSCPACAIARSFQQFPLIAKYSPAPPVGTVYLYYGMDMFEGFDPHAPEHNPPETYPCCEFLNCVEGDVSVCGLRIRESAVLELDLDRLPAMPPPVLRKLKTDFGPGQAVIKLLAGLQATAEASPIPPQEGQMPSDNSAHVGANPKEYRARMLALAEARGLFAADAVGQDTPPPGVGTAAVPTVEEAASTIAAELDVWVEAVADAEADPHPEGGYSTNLNTDLEDMLGPAELGTGIFQDTWTPLLTGLRLRGEHELAQELARLAKDVVPKATQLAREMDAVAYLADGGPRDGFYEAYAREDLVTHQASVLQGRRDVMRDVKTISGILRTLSLSGKPALPTEEPEPVETNGTASKSPKSTPVHLPAPPGECYGEIDVRSRDKGFLRVLFRRKNTDGRPTAVCAPIPMEGQLLAILVAGRDLAVRKLREAEDMLPNGRLADDYKMPLEWTQDSLGELVRGKPAARRRAIARLRCLVEFQNGDGLVTKKTDAGGAWTSTIPFRLRKSDAP